MKKFLFSLFPTAFRNFGPKLGATPVLRYLIVLFFMFYSLGFSGQVNITPVRTDVSGFQPWTDTDIVGTTYLQLLKGTSSTTSPAMDFNSYTNQTLNFKARTYGGTTAAEIILTISISTNNGGNWTVLGTITPSTNDLTNQPQIYLSAFSGTQVKVKFSVGGTNNGIGVGIDDITIQGISLAGKTSNCAVCNWNDPNAWLPVGVPTSSDIVTIRSSDIIYNTNSNLLRSAATNVNGSFQIQEGSSVDTTSQEFNYGTTGNLIFNNSSLFYGVNSNDKFWPYTNGPVNVKVLQGGFNLNGGTTRIITGDLETAAGISISPGENLTINGITTINTNGFFSSTPTYGSASTLVYKNQGGFNVGNEWNGNAGAAGKGVPKDVHLITSVLNFPNFDHGLAGNLNIDSNSSLNLNGTSGDLYIAGNWTKVGTFNPNIRAVFFNGSAAQTISGTTTFDYLTLNNSAGVTLANNVVNNFTLNLLNGKLILGANDLTIGSGGMISNATPAKYIVTNSTGQLKRTVGASNILFPLGNSAYNPITFNNTGGISDVYGVRVADQTPVGANPTKMVNRLWITTEGAEDGSNLSVNAQYNTGETGVDFAAGVDSFIGFFNGTNYTQQVIATLAGSNPFTASSTTNLTPINLTSGTQYFAIGKDNAFVSLASKLIFKSVPATGIAGTNLPTFTVEAQDVYNNVVKNFTGNIVLAKATGAGIISGTLTKAAVAGVATFSDIQLNAAGIYTITATAGSLTAAVSGNIVISPNPANAYFRSKTAGYWATPGSWESSNDGISWTTATISPTSAANTTTIRSGNNITLTSNVTLDQLIIENGGQLIVASNSGTLNINNGLGADIYIQSGGILQVTGTSDYASTIKFIGTSTMIVHGKILVGDGVATNGSDYDKLATSSAAQIIWNDGAVFEWNSVGIFATSGKIFFPDIGSAIIPIFRFSKGNAQAGGGTQTLINGVYQINGLTSNWSGNSTKIFRNGITAIGNGSIVSAGGDGNFQIGDGKAGNAELGGISGNLTLTNANGISILNSCYTTLTSTIILGPKTKFNVSSGGTLDFGFNGTAALNILGNSDKQSFSAAENSILKITSPYGITKSAASATAGNVQVPVGSRNFDTGATYHYIGKENQSTGTGLPDGLTNKVIVDLDTDATFENLNLTSAGITKFNSTGILEIRKGKVIDAPGNGFRNNVVENEDGESDLQKGNILMTGGRYVISGSGTKPSLSGTYTLRAGTIEFTGTAATKIRTSTTPKQYFNVDVSGSNVATGGKNFIVNNLLKVTNAAVFTIPEETDSANPYVVTAKRGIQIAPGGTALFLNNANLIQGIDAVNTGNITMQRKAIVPSIQYNYWSSPVSGQKLYDLYDVPDNTVMTYNSWNDKFTILPKAGNPTSVFAKGYSIKGSPTMTPALSAEFVGVPNNETTAGINSITLSTAGNNYNLIGNPYPSNLDLVALYSYNISKFYNGGDESPTIYFWDNTSNTDTSQQGSGYVNQNYAILNLPGGTGVSAPRLGTTGKKPNGIVKPGQGFIMRAAESGGDLIFKNSFITTSPGMNGNYFKGSAETNDKYWLTLTTPNDMNINIALAYNSEAENEFERFDSSIFSETVSENFYSLSSDSKLLAIQTRKGDFDSCDIIPLGIKTSKAGIHKINIEGKQGVFEFQTIYLKDKTLNIITDLSAGSYEFASQLGVDNNRFELIYKPGTVLGIEANTAEKLQVYRSGESFIIQSFAKKITEVEIYDSSGRLYRKLLMNTVRVDLDTKYISSGMYILKIKMTDEAVTKKIIK
ncbi:MAG: T9SS type A sorting domain-containing protein [Kaistella sp.]